MHRSCMECGVGRLHFAPSDDGLARRILSNVCPVALLANIGRPFGSTTLSTDKGERWVELALRQSAGSQGLEHVFSRGEPSPQGQ
jgi:hypothetical protein